MRVTELNKDNFEKEVMEANVPVLIDFWASWCGPCRMMSPVIEKIAEEMGDKLKVCKVNVDENHELAEKYEIMTIPAKYVKYLELEGITKDGYGINLGCLYKDKIGRAHV